MKKVIKIIAGICALLLVVSCKEETVATPKVAASINKTELAVNEVMKIDFGGSVADQIVVFPGNEKHDYELRNESNTGFVVNKGLFTYAYDAPGTYTVVCLASTSGDLAANLQFDTCSFVVRVRDDDTVIKTLSSPSVATDEVFAKKFAENIWVLALPRIVVPPPPQRPITINLNSDRKLRYQIQSGLTKVFVNGKDFTQEGKSAIGGVQDLSAPLDIKVVSNAGTERNYILYTVYYPEFTASSFKLEGATGTLVRTIYDYSTLEMSVNLPSGADVSNLIPTFTTRDANEKAYIGNVEQISGVSAVDFTNEVSYRLVSTVPENPEVQIESTVVVKINFQ